MLADRSHLSFDWLAMEDDGEAFAALCALPEADKQRLFAACVARNRQDTSGNNATARSSAPIDAGPPASRPLQAALTTGWGLTVSSSPSSPGSTAEPV